MSVEHHDLIHELPHLRDRIHELKIGNSLFKKLFHEYHELTRKIENMENEVTPVASPIESEHKMRRVHLKDQLYQMLEAAS